LEGPDESRRRLSSNFFDILTDPLRYQEQVSTFVNQNCADDEEKAQELSLQPNQQIELNPSFIYA
jgi:hypothetical protein